MHKKVFKGFSLIEVIMVVTILGIVLSFGFGIWQGFRVNTELDATARNIADALRSAQQKSITGEGFASWGVHFESSNTPFMQFYSGTDWATGTKYDYIPLPNGVTFTVPAPGASSGEKVEIEVSNNSDITPADSSTVTGAPAEILGTTTLQ